MTEKPRKLYAIATTKDDEFYQISDWWHGSVEGAMEALGNKQLWSKAREYAYAIVSVDVVDTEAPDE